MVKHLHLLVFFSVFSCLLQAQKEKPDVQPVDAMEVDLKEEGIVVTDSLFKRKAKINPLAPSRAAFYSAVLPGMGQIYNKRYWKVPIVYGAIGAGIFFYNQNNNTYQRARVAFKRRLAGFTDDEFYDLRPDDGITPTTADFSDAALEDVQERAQVDRDLSLVITLVFYALNIVDANVDAHLKQFNIDDDLSFDMQPYIDLNPISNNPNYGMAVVIRF